MSLKPAKPGSAGWQRLEVAEDLSLDVWVCRGVAPGKTALLTAGVHGDEYEGPAAILHLPKVLHPENLRGTVIAVPIANPLAFAADSRTTPGDGLNLARVFPGKANGSITERMAAAIFDIVTGSGVDYLIDLHSGGIEYVFLPLAGFYGEPGSGNPSYAAAVQFGLPVLWQLPPTNGVLSYEAQVRGVVAIGHEYRGAGQLCSDGWQEYSRGILACLGYWGMLEAPSAAFQEARIFQGDWQLSPSEGLFLTAHQPGDRVHTGDVLAEVLPLTGTVTPIVAEREGILLGLRSKAHIRRNNWAVLIGSGMNAPHG